MLARRSAITLLVLVGVALSAGPAEARSCGTVEYRGNRVVVSTVAGTTSCATAKRVIRRHLNDRSRCSPTSTCRRRYRDGWSCSSPTRAGSLVLSTCSRRGRTVQGRLKKR